MKNLVSTAIFLLTLALSLPLAQGQHVKGLHQFDGTIPGDGVFPHAPVIKDSAGNLFGTTIAGGNNNGDGTVFKIDRDGVESILFTFDSRVSGASPDSSLIQDQEGNLLGVAIEGGPKGGGVVFKLSPQGEFTLLHAFVNGPNRSPAVPEGGLFLDQSGNLFGTTFAGGQGGAAPNCPNGCGTIFRLDPNGRFKVLHEFNDLDGGNPFGPLVPDAKGNLYGVARAGGDLTCPDPDVPGDGCGTIFRITPNGKLTVLHTFRGGMDGATPQPGLVFNAAGDLFGATARGGRTDLGLIFRIAADGTYTVLHRFLKREGTNPNGNLVLDEAGNLFGVAQSNGFHRLGTIFELSPIGTLTVLHAFRGALDGGAPEAGMIRDSDGNFFGTSTTSDLNEPLRGGNVFEFTP